MIPAHNRRTSMAAYFFLLCLLQMPGDLVFSIVKLVVTYHYITGNSCPILFMAYGKSRII